MIEEDVRASQQKSAMFNANSQVSSFSFCVLACFLAFDCGIGKEMRKENNSSSQMSCKHS